MGDNIPGEYKRVRKGGLRSRKKEASCEFLKLGMIKGPTYETSGGGGKGGTMNFQGIEEFEEGDKGPKGKKKRTRLRRLKRCIAHSTRTGFS